AGLAPGDGAAVRGDGLDEELVAAGPQLRPAGDRLQLLPAERGRVPLGRYLVATVGRGGVGLPGLLDQLGGGLGRDRRRLRPAAEDELQRDAGRDRGAGDDPGGPAEPTVARG